MFYPTKFDVGILIGSFGLFFTLFLLFIRVLPMIAMWEIKGVVGHGAHKIALSDDAHDAEEVARA
jgi:molybdopterin-containing oxidoreductase family membrane subunit